MLPDQTRSYLEKLSDEQSLRRFLAALGYGAEFDTEFFLDSKTQSDLRAQNALAEDLQIVARHGDFPVFFGRLRGGLSVADERLIVERVIQSGESYGLFVFCDANSGCFRFLNVKRDAKTAARRRVFRRFTVDPSQSIGRTTLERLGALDLALLPAVLPGLEHSPLEVQTLHERAFDVESVTSHFYDEYEKIFGRVKASIQPKTGLPFDEVARHEWTQRLFNRLMFLRFLERKKWLIFDGAGAGVKAGLTPSSNLSSTRLEEGVSPATPLKQQETKPQRTKPQRTKQQELKQQRLEEGVSPATPSQSGADALFQSTGSSTGTSAGDKKFDYLRGLWRAADQAGENFFRDRLFWAFFGGLGHADEKQISGATQQFLEQKRGDVPFLNGGLFTKADNISLEIGCVDDQGAVALSNEMAREILDFFDAFNFTIAESTPLDVEVAVDPEMLGKVFEELVTSRNDDGAYYTPRTVVSFMARESIKRHLQHVCDEESAAIAAFVDEEDVSGLSNAENVLDALRSITVCDPACGSGAYLLGAMQELLRLRAALFAAKNLDAIGLYGRKLEIISRNLYGVDRSEFAVNIAMLRLWLSLVIDFDGPRDKIPALPNLGYKIGCGDSLAADDPLGQSIGRDQYLPLADKLAGLHHEWLEHGIKLKRRLKVRPYAEIKSDIDAGIGKIHTLFGDVTPAGAFDWRAGFAEVFAAGGFDVVVANPPYGGTGVSEELRTKFFGSERQAKDPYGIFMARGLQLLKDGGTFSFIVSDTYRTIKSHRPLRRLILDKARVAHIIDLPAWIFGATVNTSILTVQKGVPDAAHQLVAVDLRPIPSGDWNALGLNLLAVAVRGRDAQTLSYARYTFAQKQIGTYDNLSFFIASPALYALMSDKRFQKLGAVAEVKQGLATADNEYYLRKRASARGSYRILDPALLLSNAQIAALSDGEKEDGVDPKKYDGRHFVPYDKGGAADIEGGWLPNYHVPTEYFIDWSKQAVKRLKTATIADVKKRTGKLEKIKPSDHSSIASRFQNQQFYFQEAVSFSRTGVYAPTFRANAKSVFDTEGSAIFPNQHATPYLLGVLPSMLMRYLLKSIVGHTVHVQVDELKEAPLPKQADEKAISGLVSQIIKKQERSPRYEWWRDEGPQIDALVYALYGLGAAEIREIELWFCRRYERLARAQGVWARVETEHGAWLKSQLQRDDAL